MSSTIFIHGCAGQPSSWDEVIAALDPKLPLTRLRLPGHGSSSPIGEDFDGVIRDLWGQLGVRSGLRFVGYSLGARVAMGMAVHCPERISELVLVAGHPGLDSEAEREARGAWDQSWADLLRARGVEAFVDEWEALPMFTSQRSLPVQVRQAHRSRRLEHDAEGLAWSFETLGLGAMPSWWDGMHHFSGRVTVIVGEHDHKYRGIGRRLVEHCVDGTLVVVPNSGHDVVLAAPQVIAACCQPPATRKGRDPLRSGAQP